MDLLQRLSFWQTNVRTKTTAEKEETIIEINQEDGENRKETKTNIIITEIKLHLQTINVSININLKHLLVCVLYVSSVHYLYAQVQLQMFHKLAHISLDTKCINYYFCIQLSPFTAVASGFHTFLFARDVWIITNK